MKLNGDDTLPKGFVLIFFFWGIIFGEILVVKVSELKAGIEGAKLPLFVSWEEVVTKVVVFLLLGFLFWILYKKLHWLIVLIIAATLGVIMEFSFMRPEEATGPNVVENPLGAALFFIVIWPFLIGTPYALYKIYLKIVDKYPSLKPYILILVTILVISAFAYACYQTQQYLINFSEILIID